MIPPLDIFRVDSEGKFIWRTSAESLEDARRRIGILMTSEPGDYVIYSQKTGNKTLVRMQESG